MKRYAAALLALTLNACMVADAAEPLNVERAEQFMRIGGTSGWSSLWSTPTTSGTAGLVRQDPADGAYTAVTDLHLFTWNTTVRIDCKTNDAYFAWVQDADDITIAANGVIT